MSLEYIETLKRHIATHTEQSAEDSSAVHYLEDVFSPEGRINTSFASGDKWPNHDGMFEYVPNPDISRRPEQNFIVQIKGTHNYTENNGVGYKEYYTGMANGFDMAAAEAVLQVKEEYGDIMLVAAVPFRKQPLWFDAEDQLLYTCLLERVDRVVMVSENYHKGCYLRRDEYMVRKADVIVAYWDLVPKGGTFYTVSKALESGKPVINLYERMK